MWSQVWIMSFTLKLLWFYHISWIPFSCVVSCHQRAHQLTLYHMYDRTWAVCWSFTPWSLKKRKNQCSCVRVCCDDPKFDATPTMPSAYPSNVKGAEPSGAEDTIYGPDTGLYVTWVGFASLPTLSLFVIYVSLCSECTVGSYVGACLTLNCFLEGLYLSLRRFDNSFQAY